MKNIRIYLITLVTLLFVTGTFAASYLKVLYEKTYHISPGKELKVDASMGDVIISTWDKDAVYIKVLGNEKAEDKVDFNFDANEDRVEVSAKKEGGFFNWFGFNGISLRFEIKVPKNFNNRIYTSGGDIKLSDVTGKTHLKTSGGDLLIKNTTGDLKASTSGGDIILDQNKGDISITTSGGDIDARNFDGNLYASTSGGDVSLKGTNSKIHAETSGGDIDLQYWGTNKGIDLSTSGGDIHIKLPVDFSASVKLVTSGGEVSTDIGVNNVRKMSSHKLEGELNKGGSPLNATTSGGDIIVRKL
jgi:Toastrack DUF4097